MQSCNSSDSFPAQDVFWVNSDPNNEADDTAQTEFTIGDLTREFALTHRALRFYESRGLLSPQRDGIRRVFSRADRSRLVLILKGKRLGFTLTEISRMIEAHAGRATQHALKLTSERCLEQIAHFERQMREALEALAELRRIHLSLCNQAIQQAGAEPKGEPAS